MKNPIKMLNTGIVEVIESSKGSDGKYVLHLRISTTSEMHHVDFGPRLQLEAKQKAQEICQDQIKSFDTNVEELWVLDHARGGYNLLHNIYAEFDCL